MPRFKTPDYGLKMIPVDFQRQVLPGSFEFALCHLVDKELDLSALRSRFRNDAGGAPAFDPAVLLKIVLLAYSRGLVSSRSIEAACRHNVLFMAVSGDSCPHFTTLAAFVSELGDEVARLFAQVLVVCDRQKLIGRALFAIDGVKLPSNASKEKSGTRADFERQAAKMEAAVKAMMERQVAADALPTEADEARATHTRERLSREAAQIRQWLAEHPADRQGSKGSTRLSNRTDNESAKMATGKGVIQGYAAQAAVDSAHQVIVAAEVIGSGSEQAMLLPMVRASEAFRKQDTLITADAGYHSTENLQALARQNIDALIADNQMRQRDERFEGQGKHKSKADPLYEKKPTGSSRQIRLYRPEDFRVSEDADHCICPAGQKLHSNGSGCTINGRSCHKYTGSKAGCGACEQRSRCLRHPERTAVRQVAIFSKDQRSPNEVLQAMKQRIDSAQGRSRYSQRIGTVEPVFGNLRHNKRLNRFTLRGQHKVGTQWRLYCLVHNIEKLAGRELKMTMKK